MADIKTVQERTKMKIFLLIMMMATTSMAYEYETIKCAHGNETTWYTLEAPSLPSDQGMIDNSFRETACVATTRFHGDGRIGIAAYSKGPERKDPATCWKEMARTQLDGAKCCFETKGSTSRPWQACDVLGIPEKQKAAKIQYIKEMSENLAR